MKWFRRSLLVALAVSVTVHLAVVALTLKQEPEIQIEGSGQIHNAVLGSSPFNTVIAGSIEQTTGAEILEAAPLEALEVNDTRRTRNLKPVSPTQTQSISAVRPVTAFQAVATASTKSVQSSLKLPQSAPKALALEVTSETLRDEVQRAVEVVPARNLTEQTPEKRVKTHATKATTPFDVAPEKLAVAEAKPAKPNSSESATKTAEILPTNKSLSSKVVQTSLKQIEAISAVKETPVEETPEAQLVTSDVPPPPVKPKLKPTRLAEQKPEPKSQKTPKASSKSKQKDKAKRTSKGGAGGKSNTTAQKGGSQRKGNSKTAGNSDVTNYPAKVRRKLYRSVRKPRSGGPARRDAVVRFTVKKNGSVLSVSLARSSGSKALDHAVLKAVQRAAPFPPIPAAAGRNSWSFSIPVSLK